MKRNIFKPLGRGNFFYSFPAVLVKIYINKGFFILPIPDKNILYQPD